MLEEAMARSDGFTASGEPEAWNTKEYRRIQGARWKLQSIKDVCATMPYEAAHHIVEDFNRAADSLGKLLNDIESGAVVITRVNK